MTSAAQDTHRRSRFARIAALATPRPGEEVDLLGMPIRLHYWLFSFFSAVMAGAPLAMSFTEAGQSLASLPIRLLCINGLILVFVYRHWGKRVNYRRDPRLYHFAMSMGVLNLIVGSIYVGELRGPMAAQLLITPITAGYFLSARESAPWLAIATVNLIVSSFWLNEPDVVLRGSVLVIVMIAGWTLLQTTKTKLAKVLDQHKRLSETDPLTGAANVRRLRALLDEQIADSDAGGDGFALIEFDLDEFKQTNDRFNHSVGDRVLIATADAVRMELAAEDTLARRGGDEFSVIVPLSDRRGIDDLCERIGDGIARARARVCPGLKTTASIGWVAHRPGESAAELVQRADDAVHSAKAASRVAGAADRLGGAERGIPAAGKGHLKLVHEDHVVAEGPRQESAVDPIVAATSFAWKQAAILFVVVNAMMVGVALSGTTSVTVDARFLVLSTVSFGLAPICWMLSRRRQQSRLLTHVLAVSTIGVIFIGGLGRDTAAAAGAEIYMLPVIFQMYLLPVRAGLAYATVTMIAMSVAIATNGYAHADVRINTAINAVVLIGLVLAFSRKRTVEIAIENANLAGVDALTGLANVRVLRERLDAEIARATRDGGALSLLMLDLDDFKNVNDRHSHTRGDEVLAAVAATIENNVRGSETPARRGGDEFAVILADAGIAAAEAAAARLGPEIEATRASLCPDIIPTASIGAATWQPGDSVDDLLARADAALHERKMLSHAERHARRAALEVAGATRAG